MARDMQRTNGLKEHLMQKSMPPPPRGMPMGSPAEERSETKGQERQERKAGKQLNFPKKKGGKVMSTSAAAKQARAGKDMGAPGKNFSKIAASAGKKYGSKEAGERVAGAILQAKRRAGTL